MVLIAPGASSNRQYPAPPGGAASAEGAPVSGGDSGKHPLHVQASASFPIPGEFIESVGLFLACRDNPTSTRNPRHQLDWDLPFSLDTVGLDRSP